ncbi:hypothetical protein ACJIZ3_012289 [Penstemon smallii]|uniref:Uncharacterized protein n=1 Tax=Penstemon smallii TaxID=265156 RepID=A0ABD3UMR6_9LAMI
MLGCSFTSVLVVNAEVDSMGEVFEGGVGISNKTSPRQAAIEKVQAALRYEYDVREERKKELDFLEKGGNPLDFKLGTAASVSAQSTSFTDQHPDQFVTSEARGNFAITASPRGDSAESSDRPGAPPYERNSAANLLLFDAELECSEGDKNTLHPSRSNIMPSEQTTQMDGSHKAREHADSAAFGLPRKAYKRRYRSRMHRDATRSSSSDVNPTLGSYGSSLPSRHGPRDVKVSTSDAKKQNLLSNSNSKRVGSVDGTCQKTVSADCNQEMEFDGVKAVESTKDLIEGVSVATASGATASENPLDEQLNQQSVPGGAKNPIQMDRYGPGAVQELEEMTSVVMEFHPSLPATKVENQFSSSQMNGFISKKGDGTTDDVHNSSALRGINVLDSESPCTQSILSIDGTNDREMFTKIGNVDSNENNKSQTLELEGGPVIAGGEYVKGKKETDGIDSSTVVKEERDSASQRQVEDGFSLQCEDDINRSGSTLKTEEKDHIIDKGKEDCAPTGSGSERNFTHILSDNHCPQNEICFNVRHQAPISDIHEAGSLTRVPKVSIDAQTSGSDLVDKVDEDSILKEALIIEAKRKRIAELSITTSPLKIRRISRWDYVLEEMAWLANDFAQERIWKITAAAQVSYRVAFSYRLRKQGKSSGAAVKQVSHTLAKAVMEFWQERSKELEQQSQKDGTLAIHAYAARILKYNNVYSQDQAEMPLTPDRISDSGILDLSCEDNLSEENFYRIPFGAMETYRKSIESHVAQCERIGNGEREQVETSACDTAAEFESQDYEYDDDEGEASTYDISMAFDGSNSASFGQKKRKHLTHAYGPRSYDIGSELLPMQCAEDKVVTHRSSLLEKRPGSSLNVSMPTKRVRTVSRRIISPFSVGTSGFIQVLNKTDASSGDTNSFQDDQSTLRGGLLIPNSLEVESAGDFEKQLPFDSAEVSTKHKKKKKSKHLNVAYEQRWQVDPSFQHEQFQMDCFKRRSEGHQSESNGSSGLLGHPMTKKPKVTRQSQDNSFDNVTPIGGSIPSPVASQMSNMTNPNKFIKMLGSRERSRKSKALKILAAQPGSGSRWSLFEDQALVVLAHDLGPNWELVSDAINSTLHFKCIFRKARECKERHNLLMDRTSADGADSAEDSGSSQPYPSTLPGIPKGSARQLFQRLQGPMEEDTLKSHFEKIIMLGQKQHYRKTQNVNQDPKQLQQPHSSHTIALSQACPNNLNGGPILMPLELCDAAAPDILPLGFQGPQSSGLPIANQGAVTPIHPASGASSAIQGSANMMLGYNFSLPPGPLNSSARDGRYAVPRTASLSADEQQRMQHYNHMISGRNIPQSNISTPGALPGTDRGVRIIPGGNAVGMVSGFNRSTPMARPGLQGIASSSMVNSGSMGSPGMPPANMHAGAGSGQGNSMLRPREALHIMRPALSQDSKRQMVDPDLQMLGNNQGVSHFGGLSSPFPNQTASPPVSTYAVHHQPSNPMSPQTPQVLSPHHPQFRGPANHAPNPQQQAYAIRMAKERQLQHRFLQQQQPQQFASNSLMPHVHSQPQIPLSSPMQNSSQVKPQTNSPPASSMNSMHQQKHPTPSQGVVRNTQTGGSGLTNKSGKQRQKQQQQFPQASRQHPQQRQQSQAQQQAKIVKGVGRGNLMMHQNIPIDPSLINGVSTNPGNKCSEKGESAAHLKQSQGLYTGSGLHVQLTKQYVSSQSSNQSLPQEKMYSGQASSSVHRQQMTHFETSSEVHVPTVAPPAVSAGHQSGPSLAKAGSNHQQAPSNQKLVNQSQPGLHNVVQTNQKINSDPSNKPQARDPYTDQHPTSSSTEIDTVATLPQSVANATNLVQAGSPASAHKRQASEQLLDSNALNSAANLSSLVSTPSNSTESSPQVGQGHGQGQSSVGLTPIMHDVTAQWPHSPVPQQQQPLPTLHSHVQAQLLQAGKGNLYSRPSDPRLE